MSLVVAPRPERLKKAPVRTETSRARRCCSVTMHIAEVRGSTSGRKQLRTHWLARCFDCKSAKKKPFPQDDVALLIDAAPAVPAVDIDQTVDCWDEILHFDDDVLAEM